MKRMILLIPLLVLLVFSMFSGFAGAQPVGMRTSTTLRSNATFETKPGDVILLSGEVVPRPSSPVPLQVSVLNPDGTYAYNGELWTDDVGEYQLPVTAMDQGYIRAEVKFLGNTYYRASGSEMIIPIRPEMGMVIVVAGNYYLASHPWTIDEWADTAVLTFRRRGVPDDAGQPEYNRIWYLNPDISRDVDGDGQPDVDAEPTLANLKWAIETWAAGLVQTKNNSGNWWPEGVFETPLTIYLIGGETTTYWTPDGGAPAQLFVNEHETIDGPTLDTYLDTLEQTILEQFSVAGVTPPPYLPINIIVDSQFSGDFIKPLSQQGRVVITSTNGFGVAGPNHPHPELIGVSYLGVFSDLFFSRIMSGNFIHPSFAFARLMILSDGALAGQEPQLEATGEGIPNQIGDETRTAAMPLEYRDTRPRVQNSFGQIMLRDISTAMLWCYVDMPRELGTVEVTIIPPEGSFEEAHTIPMTEDPMKPNRWDATYNGFYGEGLYTIVFTAVDEAGEVAIPLVKTVLVSDTIPPLDVTDLKVIVMYYDHVTLSWSSSESPDTQGYRIYVTPSGGTETLWSDAGNVHSSNVTGLDFGTHSYIFRVTAYDRVPLESPGTMLKVGDVTPPETTISLSGTLGTKGWYLSDVTVTLTATDDISGVAKTEYSFDGTTWTTYNVPFTITTEGTHTIQYRSVDNAGNQEAAKSETIKIDKPPTTTISLSGTAGANDWYLSDVSVTLTATDTGLDLREVRILRDGVLLFRYIFIGQESVTFPYTASTEGIHSLTMWAVDQAGNDAESTKTIKIDKTAPTLTKSLSGTTGNNGWYTSNVAVTLAGNDAVPGSGIAVVEYNLNGAGWTAYSQPFTILTEGENTLAHRVTDNAGLTYELPQQTIKIDKTPPTTTLYIGEPKYVDPLNKVYISSATPFTLTAEDNPSGSGVASTLYRIYNSTYGSGWQTYTSPFHLTSLADGAYTIEYKSTDNANNLETTHTISVTLFSWNYIFQDTYGRGTTLKINTAQKFFQFTTPTKDYGIKKATYMGVSGRIIIIIHRDSELYLITTAVDTKLDFCAAIAWDIPTQKSYYLIDKVGIEN